MNQTVRCTYSQKMFDQIEAKAPGIIDFINDHYSQNGNDLVVVSPCHNIVQPSVALERESRATKTHASQQPQKIVVRFNPDKQHDITKATQKLIHYISATYDVDLKRCPEKTDARARNTMRDGCTEFHDKKPRTNYKIFRT